MNIFCRDLFYLYNYAEAGVPMRERNMIQVTLIPLIFYDALQYKEMKC